jgi:cbb3-type cytochrome oxidase subunit 3
MWLPTPIYERIPQFWLLLGLLFMSSGTYLGFDYSLSFVYFGVGFVCCIWSLWIFSMRLRSRKDQRQHPILEKAEDQQAEDVDAGAEPAA